MEAKKGRLFVVLGMHRSGTSVITHGLQVMGVNLGNRLMEAHEKINAKGFWEDIDINALDIEMLAFLKSDWHFAANIELSDVELLRKAGYFTRAVKLLRAKMDDSPLFGFKDPRVVKLLPFWKRVFEHCQLEVSYILAIRHPASVAKSLEERDDFDVEKSYLLWLVHVLNSLVGSEGQNRIVVDYDCLMQSPARELERVAKFFDLEMDQAKLENYQHEFLDESLRHTVFQADDLLLDSKCIPLAYEIYTALNDVATGKSKLDEEKLQNKIAKWVSEADRFKAMLPLLDRLVDKLTKANHALAELEKQNTELVSQNAELAKRLGEILNSRTWKLLSKGRPLLRVYISFKRKFISGNGQS